MTKKKDKKKIRCKGPNVVGTIGKIMIWFYKKISQYDIFFKNIKMRYIRMTQINRE
jgi:hypothetical protein